MLTYLRAVVVAGALVAPLIGVAGAPAVQPAEADGSPVVLTAHVDGIIHPVSAEYLKGAMDRADAEGAALLVITLYTPGGLVDSTRDIISHMIAARTPVVVYVGPSGARAASAGFLLTIAADVAVMAPGTTIGAATPVSGDGATMNETLAKKAESDVAAYARTLATKRERNVKLAEEAVTESRSFTEEEALTAEPPLIDFAATSVEDLLKQLDGRRIKRFDGTEATLVTAGARIVPIDMTWRQRLLSAIAHPQVAYLLFSLGTLGLTIELWNPGAIFPGVVGGVCLLLAFFAFQILPVNYAGLLLIIFGIVLLVLEIKITSFGLLAVGGIVSLLLGSLMLIDSPLPEMQIGLQLIIPMVASLATILLFLVRLAVKAQLYRPATGIEGMARERGRTVTAIPAGGSGRVSTHGEIWNARALESIAAGELVEVVAVDGMTLTVRRAVAPAQEGRSP